MGWYCEDCGIAKKTRKGARCLRCTNTKRNKAKGRAIRASKGITDPPWFCIMGCGQEVWKPNGRCHPCSMDYKRKYPKNNTCLDCETAITPYAKRCRSCAAVEVSGRSETIKRKKSANIGYKVSMALRRAHSKKNNRYSEAMRRRWKRGDFEDIHNDEWCENQSRRIKENWEKGSYDDRAPISQPTGIARKVAGLIASLGFTYEYEYTIDGYPYRYDIYIRELNLLVEVDGEFWHYSEFAKRHGTPDRDRKKEEAAREKGYQIVRFRGKEIKSSEIEDLVRIRIESARF